VATVEYFHYRSAYKIQGCW